MGNFGVQFRRDLLIAIRGRTETANPVAFFVLALSLFVFAVGTDSETLPRVAPGGCLGCRALCCNAVDGESISP